MFQKIFIPLLNNDGENSKISSHFGHAPFFGLYDLELKKLVIKKNKLSHDDISKTPVDQIVENANPSLVFAQEMGQKAITLFKEKNIKVKTGSYQIIKEVIKNINNLQDLNNSCNHS